MEVIGGKWKTYILYELDRGTRRPSELHRLFPDASPRVINQQLKELERHGMIEKTIYPELPPRVEYSITEDGRRKTEGVLCPLSTCWSNGGMISARK